MRFWFGLIVCLTALGLIAAPVVAREWMEQAGNSFEAEVIDFVDGIAELRKDDGNTVKLSLDKLSDVDQAYLKAFETVRLTPAAPQAANFKVQVSYLAVQKSLPDDWLESDDEQVKQVPHVRGTMIGLLVSHPQHRIIDIESKDQVCTDDRGGNLTTNVARQVEHWAGDQVMSLSAIGPQGRSVMIEIPFPSNPSRNSTKIHFKSNLVIECAGYEQVVERADVPIKVGKGIAVGKVSVNFNRVEPNADDPTKFDVALTANVPMALVKEILFLDANGQAIPLTERWAAGVDAANDTTYRETLIFEKAIEQATIRIVHYDKVEAFTVPVDLQIGLGF